MPGTITPAADFNAEKDCQELRNAMKGLGTNEAKIINVLGNRSRDQRLEIVVKFKVSAVSDKVFFDLPRLTLTQISTFQA